MRRARERSTTTTSASCVALEPAIERARRRSRSRRHRRPSSRERGCAAIDTRVAFILHVLLREDSWVKSSRRKYRVFVRIARIQGRESTGRRTRWRASPARPCVLARRSSSLRVSRASTQKTRRVCRINRDVSEVSIAAFRRLRRYRYRSRKRRNRDDPTRVHRRRPRWQPSSARSLWQLTTSSLALSLSIELPAPPKCGRSLPVSTRWSIVAALNIPPIGAARRR